jgi:hypothetical protein
MLTYSLFCGSGEGFTDHFHNVTNANSGCLKSIGRLDCLKTRILSYRTKGVQEVCKLYIQSSAVQTSLRSQVTTRPEHVGNRLASCGQTVTHKAYICRVELLHGGDVYKW